jgi:hypothetical protein
MPKIRFYPFSEASVEFAPKPKLSARFVPEWYRSQPSHKGDQEMIPGAGVAASTVKRCMPIFDGMTAGYMLSAPCDIYLDATNPEKLEWSIPMPLQQFKADLFAFHSPEQYENYPVDPEKYHKQIFRIMPGWAVGTDEGYSTLYTNPYHSDDSPLWAFGAIVDTDRFITDGHLSFLVKKDFKGTIKQGTPIAQLIPFKREAWESEIVDAKESRETFDKQRFNLRSTFINGYKNKFRSKKDYK